MRFNAQHTNDAACMNALRVYGNRSAAILLMTSADPDAALGLERVFALHEGPYLNLENDLDWDLDTVGDCIIKTDGIKVVIEGRGNFMGMVFENNWGEVDQSWREAAEINGCVWIALVSATVYERALAAGRNAVIPITVPMLKLDTV